MKKTEKMSEKKIPSGRCQEPETAQADKRGTGSESAAHGASPVDASLRGSLHTLQVKICGLTDVDEALACVESGAKAIGCVFYPPSPRHLTDEKARDICRHLPSGTCTVGVFVNESHGSIMSKVERCGLKAVQLHGRETAGVVDALLREGVMVIKAVFVNGSPSIGDARAFGASAYLVECAGGKLPGGNALEWDWGAARGLGEEEAVIIAGGLNPENVSRAIDAAQPDALDVSSGVEAEPGKKDLDKVKQFLQAVSRSPVERKLRQVFG